jgi:hypothetical protein
VCLCCQNSWSQPHVLGPRVVHLVPQAVFCSNSCSCTSASKQGNKEVTHIPRRHRIWRGFLMSDPGHGVLDRYACS